jgi:hypothetical protein
MANPADSPVGQDDPISVAKMSYRAYVDKDRSAIERLKAPTIFTSPARSTIASIETRTLRATSPTVQTLPTSNSSISCNTASRCS